jgi:hypothetical protein
MIKEILPHDQIEFTYKNWKDIIEVRKAEVDSFYFGTTQWHKEPQFFLLANDLEKKQMRQFALKDISDLKVINRED